MKHFNCVIGNPPYMQEVSEKSNQAPPIYNLFIEEAKKISEDNVVMITPSRWFSGGMGLDAFRERMITDKKIRSMCEYTNGKECFPGTSISGGVSYFVWDKHYNGPCNFTNILNGNEMSMVRYLDEYPVLVRDNNSVHIIRKLGVSDNNSMSQMVSVISPFSLSTKVRGKGERENGDLRLFSSQGTSYISNELVKKDNPYTYKYKAMLSQTSAEHAGEPSKDGSFRVFTASMRVLEPGDVCTHSYIVVGPFETQFEAENVIKYMQTKFVRFLALQAISSIHISRMTFCFVPVQDFTEKSDIRWENLHFIDEQLYKKYKLSNEEIQTIENKIKEMK